jgi:hypothetical protein
MDEPFDETLMESWFLGDLCLGYQAVEVPVKDEAAPEANAARQKEPASEQWWLPRDAAEVPVVEPVEEKSLPPAPPRRKKPVVKRWRPPRRWLAIAVGGSFLLAFGLVLLILFRLAPEAAGALPDLPGLDTASATKASRGCQRCDDRETLGTAVAFVRNPAEALRQAVGERKLVFLLHVSGNFEDSGFT